MSRLSLPLLLSRRYLRSTRRDAFVSFLCALTVGGITLGVAALILALAALSGFQSELLAEVLAHSPQVEVALAADADPQRLAETVASTPGVDNVQTLLYGRGWLRAGGNLRQVELVGFEKGLPAWFPEAPAVPQTGLFLPQSLADQWNLWSGDRVQVVSPRPTLTPLGPQPRMRRLPMSGTYREGRADPEVKRVALPLEPAISLLDLSDLRLDVTPAPGIEPVRLAERLRQELPAGVEVRSWRDLHAPLVFVLRLEKGMIFVAVLLIVLVASFALVASLALIISSRRSEIGILGAMGAPPRLLHRTFLLLGAELALLGAGLGALLGTGSAWLLDRYRVLSPPEDVFIVDYVPFLIRSVDLLAIAGATLLLTLAASFWAARKVAGLEPVEALEP